MQMDVIDENYVIFCYVGKEHKSHREDSVSDLPELRYPLCTSESLSRFLTNGFSNKNPRILFMTTTRSTTCNVLSYNEPITVALEILA